MGYKDMTIAKCFNAAEIAAYNAAHTTPHRKVITAQVAESKLPPRVIPEGYKYGEFASREKRGAIAEEFLQHKMMHGEDS